MIYLKPFQGLKLGDPYFASLTFELVRQRIQQQRTLPKCDRVGRYGIMEAVVVADGVKLEVHR